MKIERLEIRGIGKIKESTLPVDKLTDNDRIVAIIGPNGGAKTTHIESLPGVLYGSMPSRGTLASMANTSQSCVQAEVSTDQRYRIERRIAGTRKTPVTEAYLFGEDGTPLNDGKQGTFDAEIAKRFPSERVFLASGFASQRKAGQFLTIDKAERKALFVEMIGCGGLQTISEAAGVKANTLEKELSDSRSKMAVYEAQAAGIPKAKEELGASEEAAGVATDDRQRAEVLRDIAVDKIGEWRDRYDESRRVKLLEESALREVSVALSNAKYTLGENRKRLAELIGRRAALVDKLAGKDEVEKLAVQETPNVEKIEETLRNTRKDTERARSEVTKWELLESKAKSDLAMSQKEYTSRVATARQAAEHAGKEVDRLTAQSAGLGSVPCGGEGKFAVCPLIGSAVKARDGIGEARCLAQDLVGDLVKVTADRSGIDKAAKAVDAIGPRPAMPDDSVLVSLESQLSEASRLSRVISDAKAKMESLTELGRVVEQITEESEKWRAEISAGEVCISEFEDKVQLATLAVGNATKAVTALLDNKPPEPMSESELNVLRAKESESLALVARLKESVAACTRAVDALADLRTNSGKRISDLDDWRHLQKAFGRDGIQALEVDAAGPEVSALVNELLHSCFGPRFTVRLQTTALKRDGTLKEIFDLVVIDTETGHEGSASELSGGESVLVGEALGLAIAIFNARRSSIPIADIFRDEVSGALSPGIAPLYVTMLRRAIILGALHRVFFVTHQPALVELADSVIVVEDGVARIGGQNAIL